MTDTTASPPVSGATSTADVVAKTALATAESLLPVILQGAAAGAAAVNPTAATIAALSPIVVELIKSGNMDASELSSLVTQITGAVQSNQAQIDALAAARGVTDPTKSTQSTPASGS